MVAFLLGTFSFLVTPAVSQSNASSNTNPKTDSEKYLNQSLDSPVQQSEDEEITEFEGTLGNSSSGTNMFWFLLKIGFALIVVVAGIWLVSKFLEKSGMTGANNELMGVRSTLPLGQNQYLQIVQVGKQFFMLGVTDNQVSMLDEITDSDTIRSLKNSTSDGSGGNGGFGDIIRNAIGTDSHQFNEKDTGDYLDELQQKISRLGNEREVNS